MNVSKLAKIRNVRLDIKKLSPRLSYSSRKSSQKSLGGHTWNVKHLESHISTKKSAECKSTTRLQRQHYSSLFDENRESPASSDNSSTLDEITDDTSTAYYKKKYEFDKSLDSSHDELFSSSSRNSSDDICCEDVCSDEKSDTSNDNKHVLLRSKRGRVLLSDSSEETDDDNTPLSRKTPRFDEKLSSHETDLSLRKSKFPKWPVDTSKSECIRRNDIIRSYIINHDWYVSAEFHLVRTLIMKPPSHWRFYSNAYPFIFDFEWVNEEGKGDLIYTDGDNNFLVVEVKSMYCDGYGSGETHRKKKRQKRRDGEKQTEIYSQLWHEKNPQVKKTTGVFVTEHNVEKISFFTR